MTTLTTGSHIQVSRFGYSHHGIYVGNDLVIHYSGFAQAFDKGAITLTTLEEFLDDEIDFDIVAYPSSQQCYSAEEIVERAYSRLGEDNYSLMFNNCEHFACWCVTGSHSSQQVNRVMATVSFVSISLYAVQANATTSSSLLASSLLARPVAQSLAASITSSSSTGMLSGMATGATAGAGLAGATAGAGTAFGLVAGATTVAAAPVVVPIGAAIIVGTAIGGILGSLFD